jgi:chorismate mutase
MIAMAQHAATDNGADGALPAERETLPELRERIDRIDHALVALLAERVAVARRVGQVKAADGLPITDPSREAAVVARASRLAREAGLPDDDVRALFWQLLAITRRAQAKA